MSEFIRSALGYFSGTSGEDNDFVGQIIDLGGKNKLKIKKVIAEGGFGFVFIAQDVRSNKLYALKRLIVSKDQVELVKKEISFLKILSGHTNIIQFVAATGVPASKTGHGSAEFLIQTELCTGGQLLDVTSNNRLSPRQVLRVFYETCSAVAHMHNQIPPIIHRDLKVENLLLSSTGEVKLCDFGSATTERIQPDDTWSQSKRGLVEEEIQRNTTPMYRAPEMIDLYNNYPIDQRTDVWALGCLLFKLCYKVHPFEDSSKLSIINVNYKIPEDDISFAVFQPLIKACLVVDPCKRPPVNEIIAHLYSVAQQLNEDLNSEPTDPLPLVEAHSEGEWLEQTAQQAQRLFGFVKGGAGHLIKNIKDTSSKMMHTVAGKRTTLDISYITSRILVMSLPSDDQLQGHNLDEVRGFLDARHPEQYLVFNLSDHTYDTSKLHNQVADFNWPSKHVADLEQLVDLCTSIDSWLRADVNNVVVVHCTDGKLLSATVVTAYLVFIGVFSSPLTGYKLFNLKRNQPDGSKHSSVNPPASYLRYTQCIANMVHDDDGNYGNGTKPHPHPITIYSIKMTNVPIFSMNRSGCKPFVEVFHNGERVFTSIGQDEMDKLRSYTAEDGEILIPIGVGVCGNILITVHHIRAIPIVKMSGRGMSAVRMFQCQFHTGFVRSDWTELKFSRSELDGSSVMNENKFPSPFNVVMSVAVDTSQQGLSAERCASWKNLPHPQDTPLTCFTSSEEQQSVMKNFLEFDTRARLHHNKKKQKQQQQHGGLHSAVNPYHDHPPTREQQRNEDHSTIPSDPTTAGYIPYRDQDEVTGSSSSSDDSDSDSSIPIATRTVHNDATSQSQEQAQFGALLNLDSPPASTTNTAGHGGWVTTTSSAPQTDDDLAAVFGNPSAAVKTANLLDITLDEHSDTDGHSKLAPPMQTNRSASSSIENLLFGDDISSSTVQQPPLQRPASYNNLFGSNNVFLQPQATTYREPTVIGNMMTQTSSNFPVGVTTQLHGGSHPGQKSSSATKDDPFAQFVTLQSSNIPSSQNSTPGSSPWPGTSPYPGGSPRSGGSPIPPAVNVTGSNPPRYGMNTGLQSQVMGSQYSQAQKNKPYSSSTATQATTGVGANKPAPKKPQPANYTSVIGDRKERGIRRTANPTGIRPKLNADDFQDLLGNEGFNVQSKSKEPQTLSDMQDIGDLRKEQDPDRAKVKAWAKGKEKNIRALISSLHLILWEGETRWSEVGMHQLVQPEEVRKYYKKACLVAHPDKLIGLPYENLARQIFIALNEAHTIFEESGGQALF